VGNTGIFNLVDKDFSRTVIDPGRDHQSAFKLAIRISEESYQLGNGRQTGADPDIVEPKINNPGNHGQAKHGAETDDGMSQPLPGSDPVAGFSLVAVFE
jgi:hypothetical protein